MPLSFVHMPHAICYQTCIHRTSIPGRPPRVGFHTATLRPAQSPRSRAAPLPPISRRPRLKAAPMPPSLKEKGSGSLLVDTRYGRIMLGAGEKAKRHALAMRQRGQDSVSASVDPSAAVGEVEGITSVLDAGGLTSYANVPPSLSAIYRVSNNNPQQAKGMLPYLWFIECLCTTSSPPISVLYCLCRIVRRLWMLILTLTVREPLASEIQQGLADVVFVPSWLCSNCE